MQDRRELRTLRSQLDASTSPRGAGCESKPSWLPPHKTRMAANSLQAGRKKLEFFENRTPPCLLVYTESQVAATIGGRRAALGFDSRGGCPPVTLDGRGARPHTSDLPTKEVLRQEHHIRRALCQTPHKVGIPLGAERDVNAHTPAVFHQGLLQVAPDAV